MQKPTPIGRRHLPLYWLCLRLRPFLTVCVLPLPTSHSRGLPSRGSAYPGNLGRHEKNCDGAITPKAGLESVAEVVDTYQQAARRQR